MKSFEELLEISVAAHGHLCSGQIIGVLMSMLGLSLIGVDPEDKDSRKKVIVFVEIDRCATDAIQSVTGCRLGKRTMKFKDFGVNAATFVNLETGKAFRIVSTEESRDIADALVPEESEPAKRQIIGYQRMKNEDLFAVTQVTVKLGSSDMPGPTKAKAVCVQCGQVVRDGREMIKDGKPYCRVCGGDAYFTPLA